MERASILSAAVRTFSRRTMRNKPHREDVPQRRSRTPPGPVPTLGELQHGTPWVWAYCQGLDRIGRPCMHRTPLALAPFVIRWGAEASSDVMRERLRCAVCGHRGTVLQHPSWMDAQIGEQPFPANWVGIVNIRQIEA